MDRSPLPGLTSVSSPLVSVSSPLASVSPFPVLDIPGLDVAPLPSDLLPTDLISTAAVVDSVVTAAPLDLTPSSALPKDLHPDVLGGLSDLDEVKGKAFVGGVSWDTTEESMREYFERYGEVKEVVLMRHKLDDRPRGFGFVTFVDAKTLENALRDVHVLDNKRVEVKKAVPRDSAPASRARFEQRKLFVGGLPPSVDDPTFEAYFAQYGEVTDAVVMMDRETDRSRGFGFVTFASEATVAAVLEVQEHTLNGRVIEIKRAQPRAERSGFGRGRDDGGRGGRGGGGWRGGRGGHHGGHYAPPDGGARGYYSEPHNGPYGGGFGGGRGYPPRFAGGFPPYGAPYGSGGFGPYDSMPPPPFYHPYAFQHGYPSGPGGDGGGGRGFPPHPEGSFPPEGRPMYPRPEAGRGFPPRGEPFAGGNRQYLSDPPPRGLLGFAMPSGGAADPTPDGFPTPSQGLGFGL